MPAIEF